jgi:hypothetical protein
MARAKYHAERSKPGFEWAKKSSYVRVIAARGPKW